MKDRWEGHEHELGEVEWKRKNYTTLKCLSDAVPEIVLGNVRQGQILAEIAKPGELSCGDEDWMDIPQGPRENWMQEHLQSTSVNTQHPPISTDELKYPRCPRNTLIISTNLSQFPWTIMSSLSYRILYCNLPQRTHSHPTVSDKIPHLTSTDLPHPHSITLTWLPRGRWGCSWGAGRTRLSWWMRTRGGDPCSRARTPSTCGSPGLPRLASLSGCTCVTRQSVSHVNLCHTSICVTRQSVSHVNLCHTSICVTRQSVSHVSLCHTSVCVTRQSVSHVSLCHMSVCVTRQSVSHISLCHMSVCQSVSHVNLCHMSVCVTCQSVSHVNAGWVLRSWLRLTALLIQLRIYVHYILTWYHWGISRVRTHLDIWNSRQFKHFKGYLKKKKCKTVNNICTFKRSKLSWLD